MRIRPRRALLAGAVLIIVCIAVERLTSLSSSSAGGKRQQRTAARLDKPIADQDNDDDDDDEDTAGDQEEAGGEQETAGAAAAGGGGGDESAADPGVELSTLPRDGNSSAVNAQRLRLIRDVCDELRQSGQQPPVNTSWLPGPVDDMLVDDRLRYMYCPIGKVATRSWKYVLLQAAGKKVSVGQADNQNIIRKYLPQLRKFLKRRGEGASGVEQRLRTYYKFLMVREPLERFVSAYNYLFRVSSFYQHTFGADIIKRYRQNTTAAAAAEAAAADGGEAAGGAAEAGGGGKGKGKGKGKKRGKGRGVRIDEFARYVVDDYAAGRTLDRHWRPQHILCHPCIVQYQYIGHYETITPDAASILRQLNVSETINFPFHKSKRTTPKMLQGMLDRIPKPLLKQLLEVYRLDYRLFGYPPQTDLVASAT